MAPNFTLYHPNAKGTGSALRITRILPQEEVDGRIYSDGVFRFALAPQKGGMLFDWNNATSFCLDAVELAEMLQVLRGESEAIADRRGFIVPDDDDFCRELNVRFMHRYEPTQGFLLEVSEPGKNSTELGKFLGGIFLSIPEAITLQLAIEQSLHLLVFGAPNA